MIITTDKLATASDVIYALKIEVERQGSQSALARVLGVSPAYISDVIAGQAAQRRGRTPTEGRGDAQ